MFLSQTNKKLCFALGASLVASYLYAAPANQPAQQPANCGKQAFNISINEAVTLSDILTQLSDMCRFSVVAKDAQAAEELKQVMNSVSIKDLSLREIFDILITENNMNYEFSNNALKVSSLQTKTFKVDYITSTREGVATTKTSVDAIPVEVGDEIDSEREGENQILAKESFDFWKNISEEITTILNNGTETYVAVAPIVNPQSGMITVTATKSQIARVDRYLKEMQRRMKRQVLLDVHIVEVILDNEYSTGIDWSAFELGFGSAFRSGSGRDMRGVASRSAANDGILTTGARTFSHLLNFNVEGMINFLETKGKTKVVSSPKVMAINNQPALISVGDTINYNLVTDIDTDNEDGGTTASYTGYSVFVGILLNILPEISDDNRIMLRINPSVSTFANEKDMGGNYGSTIADLQNGEMRAIAPDTHQKKISTVVTVGNGDTVILGGLISQNKQKDHTSVPILSSLPLIGGLFEYNSDYLKTTELVFVVTPRLVDNTDGDISDSLKDLGYSKSIAEY